MRIRRSVTPRPPALHRGQDGQLLLGVLVLILAVTASSVTFVWYMNQLQTRAGARYRAAAALNVADAGVHRALAALESQAPEGGLRGREWRPQGYQEAVQVGTLPGRFVLSMSEESRGARIITSAGEVGGVVRRIRVRAYLASPALLAALNGAGIVKIDAPPATTMLLPYGTVTANRAWVHMMAGRAVWFSTAGASLNDPEAHVAFSPGPVDAAAGLGKGTTKLPALPLRIVLPRDAILSVGGADQTADVTQLRAFGVSIQDIVRAEVMPDPPAIDRGYYQSLAAANTANAAVNREAGLITGDHALEQRAGSDYSGGEFVHLLDHLAAEQYRPRLRGVIYVHGSVTLPEGAHVIIEDGALITESTVHLSRWAELSVVHSPATRTLPGLMVQDLGTLALAQESRLHAHGLVYVNRAIDVGEGAAFDVVGAVVGNNPGISFRAYAAAVIIRYDPAVLGTPGLLIPEQGPVVVWIASWEEVP